MDTLDDVDRDDRRCRCLLPDESGEAETPGERFGRVASTLAAVASATGGDVGGIARRFHGAMADHEVRDVEREWLGAA